MIFDTELSMWSAGETQVMRIDMSSEPMVAPGKTYDPVDERIVISSGQDRPLKRENNIVDIRDKRSGYVKRPRFWAVE